MDEEDVEELDLTGKNHDDSNHRTAIMRQLINDLFLINEFERNFTHRHPFSTLEVILEEVTPSPSQQTLQDNIRSAIKSDRSNDSGEYDSDSSNSQNQNQNQNFKMYRRQGSCSDQSTASGITTARSFNDSNTSNIDVQNSDRCKEKKHKTANQNDETSSDRLSDKQQLYHKYDQFINDDTPYMQRDSPRSKFLTLNKKYERDKAKQKQKKYKNHIYRTDTFHCSNSYAVKTPHIEKNIDYNKCSVQELETRLQYFEKQIQDLQNEYKTQKQSSEENSPKDENDSQDRGDFKPKKSPKPGISFAKNTAKITPDPTVIIVGSGSVQHINKPAHTLSPTVIIKQSEFPKVMYASSNRNVSTQVEDTDWQRICYTKKEMSESGSLRISLPNSIDEESSVPITRRRVDFDSYSTEVNYRSPSDVTTQRTSAVVVQETTDLAIPEIANPESKWGWLSCCRNMFSKK